MENLKIKDNKISFIVMPSKIFNNPVTPLKNNVQNSLWDIGIRFNKRKYQGQYQGSDAERGNEVMW
ncbi:MAG: hypothetical protein GY795_02305 [Desulfobacterales bacterium]|nr:hypothetical protein [Desulfobacterales bacterium]